MKKLLVLLSLVLLVVTGCSSEKEEPVKTEYVVGETVTAKGLKITLNGSRLLEEEGFMKPDEGTQWIAVNFTFENTSDKSIYIGGIFELTLRDDNGVEKEMNIWGELEGKVDGDILPGEKLTGEKSFVIKGDEQALFAYYKSSKTGKDPLKFIVK